MGEIADMLLEQSFEFELFETLPRYELCDNETVWVTREGERIEIRNLEDSHIVNILRLDARTPLADWLQPKVHLVREEARRRGIEPTIVR